jgi:branched-chain amino acid transport system permease protein
MTKFVQLLLQTLTLGSLYALIALGYTLVYGILRFINFAHSDIFTFGAWMAFTIATAIGWATTDSPVFAMPVVMILAMAAAAALGFSIERLAYRPLRRAPRLNVLITAIGVSLLLQNVGALPEVFGKDPVSRCRRSCRRSRW